MPSEKIGVVSISETIPNISIYEIVDSVPPDVSPRSWAYHLTPIGIGHSYAESLTSYFARLAKEHKITPRILFNGRGVDKENNRSICGLVEASAGKATAQINGPGLTAENWVAMVEGLTLQKRLRYLTFLTWRPVFNRSMSSPERAWCPSCLEDMRLAKELIYEHLSWTHRSVQVCYTHKSRLETKCPYCAATSWVLYGTFRPGFCRSCNRWLGHHSSRSGSIYEELDAGKADYEIFAAKQIGELISIAPRMICVLDREMSKRSIIKCAEQFFDGNLHAFVKFFGLGNSAADSLGGHKICVPQIELLLRVGFQADVSLFDLLTTEDSLDGFNPSRTSIRLSPRMKKENVLKVLSTALEENPPPSLKELVLRLGYRHTQSLRHINAPICDQIIANFKQSARGKVKNKYSTKRLHEDKVIKSSLESALKEDPPPTISHIARQLGYKTAPSVRSRFPDLCKALADKGRRPSCIRRAQSEIELQRALDTNPPMSLDAIAKKLGYKTDAVLCTRYPKLCRKIKGRYTKYKEAQLILRVRNEVKSILAESPPPTLKVALQRIGVSWGYFRKHFPNEHRSISDRYLEFRKAQSEQNKGNDKCKIRTIVRNLINKGIFPSMNAVLDIYIASSLTRPEVWATIVQAREEFGFRI